MPASVTLRVAAGRDGNPRTIVVIERTTRIIGRANDCDPRLPEDGSASPVSRHHCLLDINPPEVRVRDLGSLNGTFVNGQEIGRRARGQTPEEGARLRFRERDLADGDEVRLGNLVITIGITVVADCRGCGIELPAGDGGAEQPDRCDRCKHQRVAPGAGEQRRCGRCRREMVDGGGHRRGDVVCEQCRADSAGAAADLVRRAESGDSAVSGIRGYEILRELGRGGQGVVHLARHVDSGELVALKVLLAEVAVQEAARDGFLREIQSLQVLRHRNIVEFRHSGYSRGTFFLASEFCDGGSVDRLCASHLDGTLPLDQAVPIVCQVLDGLDHAHTGRPGLVHRDVKPHNILLAGTGAGTVAKLGDFGLAKAFDQAGLSGHTRTGSVAGSVAFMSRVQLLDFKFSRPEVDVWAAAATLYWMLTGAPPRDFPSGVDPILAVLNRATIPIRRRRPALPRRLARVIDEALVEQPRILVISAAELRSALQDAL